MTLKITPSIENTAEPIQGDTILVYLVDRSGSMGSCWEETIGGLNADVATQKEADDGNTEIAMYFFDGNGFGNQRTRLVKPVTGKLTEATEISDSRASDYAPYGSTPLYDAVGCMITEIRDRVEATSPKPNVLVSIFTDGDNTDSHGHSPESVKRMVETCQGEGWTFTYFGANQDAWAVGSSFGIASGNTMSYSTDNMAKTMATASAARSMHMGAAKAAYASGDAYTSTAFFRDAGQSEDDYKK